jgi:hypothetical protein
VAGVLVFRPAPNAARQTVPAALAGAAATLDAVERLQQKIDSGEVTLAFDRLAASRCDTTREIDGCKCL